MRAKVTNAEAKLIVEGPGMFLVRNKTASANIFLEVGSIMEDIEPTATEAEGYEWEKGAGLAEIRLGPQQALTGIVVAAGAEQELHILRNGPHF